MYIYEQVFAPQPAYPAALCVYLNIMYIYVNIQDWTELPEKLLDYFL